MNCVFCELAATPVPVELDSAVPGDIVRVWSDAVALVPLGPVVDGGHLLVIPRTHVADVAVDATVSAATMAHAAELLEELDWQANMITSRGREATQSVFHLHIHLVRRQADDSVSLPWDVRA